MKKLLVTIILIYTLLSVGGCSSGLELEGVVETSIYSQYSEVTGRISKQPIELGQQVKAGDVIAEIDESNAQYALEQLKLTLTKKQATLDEILAGSNSAEIKQGQNNVKLAEIAYNNARLANDQTKKDLENAQILYEEGAISQSDIDKVKYQADLAAAAVASASAQLDNARQKLNLLREGARKEKIAFAEADVKLTESQIRQTEADLAKYKVKAVTSGTIISKNYLLGNIVNPGFNLADIASDSEKYLVAYLPEEYLNKISYGQQLVIKSGESAYQGVVSFIDVKAEYTPKEMQTSANKNKESMKIKIKLTEDIPLKVGERAKLIITKQ